MLLVLLQEHSYNTVHPFVFLFSVQYFSSCNPFYKYILLSVCLSVCLSMYYCDWPSGVTSIQVSGQTTHTHCDSQSVCLSVCLSIPLHVHICLHACLLLCLCVCLFVPNSACLFFCLLAEYPVHLSVCLSVNVSSCFLFVF